ncbi:DoxX family protein [Fodinicola acaciae]|uniref:DoxX family protein n=1 Tax=Fodinicola acaciae TaxID=2681555 RepID=UPI0013D5BFC6|nr:DoxX family protein [Fodinicola acaciae]
MASIANDELTERSGVVRSTGLLVLRVMVGLTLLVHGIPKLGRPGAFIETVAGLGVPLPTVAGILQMAGEVGLGVALLVGVLSRVAGVLVAVMMALTWAIVHAPEGLLSKSGISGESAVLLGLGGVVIALLGAGAYSGDALLAKLRKKA